MREQNFVSNKFYILIIIQFENAQNFNLFCWIKDLLRKPQISEWLFIIAEIEQGECLKVPVDNKLFVVKVI